MKRMTAGLMFVALVCAEARAAEEQGLTVAENATVMVKATRLEVDLEVSGEAELSSDALVKYRQASRQVATALKGLGIQNLSVEHRGIGMQQTSANSMMAAMRVAGAAAGAKPQFRIDAPLRVTITNISSMSEEQLAETMTKVIDTAKDAGAGLGSAPSGMLALVMASQQTARPLVRFIVDDVSSARDQAFKQAHKQAADRARQWAQVAGVKLGKTLALEEVTSEPAPSANPQAALMAMYGAQTPPVDTTRITSDRFTNIPVQVRIKARFEIR